MRFMGWDDRFEDNGMGTSILYVFFIPVWKRSFHHSTFWTD